MVIEYVLVAIYFALIGLGIAGRQSKKDGEFAWGTTINSLTVFPLWACLTFVGPLGIVTGFITMGITVLALIVLVIIAAIIFSLMGYTRDDISHNASQGITLVGSAIYLIIILIML